MNLFAIVAAPLLASASLRGANTDTLHAGESLTAGQQLTSGGGMTKFVVQGDGNLVLYQTFGHVRQTWSRRAQCP